MNLDLDQTLILGLTTILIAIVGYVAKQVVNSLETGEVYLAHWLDGVTRNKGNETYNTIVEYARLMIQAAEDKAKSEGWDGEAKLNYATDKLYDFIAELQVDYPIRLTRENVENIVRGVYTEWASWFDKFEPEVSQIE